MVPPMTEIQSARWVNIFVKVFSGLLTIASIVFIVSTIQTLPHGSVWIPDYFSIYWVILSTMLAVAQLVLVAIVFGRFVGAQTFGEESMIFLISQSAKYVPGRVWGMFLQKFMLGPKSSASNVISANLLVISVILASQTAGFASAFAYLCFGAPMALLFLVLIACAAGLAAFVLKIFSQRYGWRLLSAWNRNGVEKEITIYVVLTSLLGAAAWILLYRGGLGYGMNEAIGLFGVSSASIIAGTLSLLPAGLGVREAAFLWLTGLQWPLPDKAMPTLALLSRVWLLAVDILAILLGIVLRWRIKKRIR
jgi:glycosyltransferase 2 family protein